MRAGAAAQCSGEFLGENWDETRTSRVKNGARGVGKRGTGYRMVLPGLLRVDEGVRKVNARDKRLGGGGSGSEPARWWCVGSLATAAAAGATR